MKKLGFLYSNIIDQFRYRWSRGRGLHTRVRPKTLSRLARKPTQTSKY